MTLRGLYILIIMTTFTLAARADVNVAVLFDEAGTSVESGAEDNNAFTQFVHIDAKEYAIISQENAIISKENAIDSKENCLNLAEQSAQSFSIFPRFTTEVFLGSHAANGYKIELRYPEFQELTSKEAKAIKRQLPSRMPVDFTLNDSVRLFPCATPVYGLELEHYVSISQLKDYVNVSFSPIVYHDGKWKRIVSCQIKIVPLSQPQQGALLQHRAPSQGNDERWAAHSVLATGKWCKVRVEEEGIYQLNGDAIKKMGFSDLSKIKVYGYGGLLQDEVLSFPAYDAQILQNIAPDDLVEVPVLETTDGRILFWMEGTRSLDYDVKTKRFTHKQNHYSRYSYYFITENDAPRKTVSQIDENDSRINETAGTTKVIDAVPYVTVYDPDTYNWYPGGRKMFDSFDFNTNNVHSYRLQTPDCIDDDSFTPTATVSIGASSATSPATFKITFNGVELASQTVNQLKADTDHATISTKNHTISTALSAADGNVIQLTKTSGSSARIDYLRLHYMRRLTAASVPYSFTIPETAPVKLKISDASSNVHLWRLGQNGVATEEVAATLKNNTLEADVSTPARRFVFFDASQNYNTPEFVANVEPQDLHAHHDVDFVIIVPASGKLVEQAERLGKLHAEHDGLTYEVIRADQLYNEFSSGTPDASAYRRYLKMLYDRAAAGRSSLPRYCLLMGKSPWDNRFLSDFWSPKSKNIDDYLLAFEVDNNQEAIGSVNSYVSDDFYGFLDDGEGNNLSRNKLDIALGRMVCLTSEDAEVLINKVEQYISNKDAGKWKNTIAILADDGDNNGHIKDAEAVSTAIESVAPYLNINKIYWDRYKWTSGATGYTYPQGTASIKKQMKDGALIFNYSGHGSPDLISHQKVLQISDFAEAYSPYMPLWVLASCEIYPFDSNETNLAETSLFVRGGGSIGFVCATRSVYASYNNAFNRAYCQHVLTTCDDGHLNTMGEALRLAKNDVVNNNRDLTINKLKYVLFGDPALRLALPTGSIVLDSINGKAITDRAQLTNLPAGGVALFSGHVCGEDGKSVDSTFDGDVNATIYDAAADVTCQNNHKDDSGPYVFRERQRVVYNGTTKASGGKFSFRVAIPRDISYSSDPGRISFYAVSNDKQHEYKGMDESFCMNGTADGTPDDEAPRVIAFINSIDNPDYTICDANPILIANISDESGINCSGLSLGHDIELTLDGNNAESISLNDYFQYDFDSYQQGQLVYQLHDVAPGNHTATLRVWDICNNVATTDVHFIVSHRDAKIGKHGYVTASKNPAYSDTRLIGYHPTVEGECERTTFEIYDHRGSKVASLDATEHSNGCSILPWNLRTDRGTALNAGVYFCRAVFHIAGGTQTSEAQKLIIVQ